MKLTKLLCFVSALFFWAATTAKADIPEVELTGGDSVYVKADKMPEPVGGMESLTSAIEYPEIAKRAGIEGKVFVTFIVDEKGKVVSPSILKSSDPVFNGYALEAVKKISFSPGKVKGKPVKVKVTIPIDYKLDAKDKFVQSDEQAFPVGGMNTLFSKLQYPEEAMKNNIQGKVVLKAVIDTDGNVEKIEVIQGLGYGCDEAAIKAFKSTKFVPAKKAGKPVRSEIALPVNFKLQ